MTAQNIYDDPDFLAGYATLDRQVDGLDGAPEWPALRSMLPDLAGRRVLDLGCGFGWFSRWAEQQGAVAVLGIDVSTKMLERAQADTNSTVIGYQRVDLDLLDLVSASVDLTFSSLTLHYVRDLDRLLRTLASSVVSGGSMVVSVEQRLRARPDHRMGTDGRGGGGASRAGRRSPPSMVSSAPSNSTLSSGRQFRVTFRDLPDVRHRRHRP